MNLLVELRRRGVLKVGAVYLVGGWVLVQAASIALPAFDAPAGLMRPFILLVLLGFPLALALAWMLELTPQGMKVEGVGEGGAPLLVVTVVLALLAVAWFIGSGTGISHQTPGAGPPGAAALGPRSTAVLPFVNMSAAKDDEYFSDGLTENLLHRLAQVKELKVVARTSSFAFKGQALEVREIGRRLGVATVVEGSVQRSGDVIRITAQLIRTADGSHLWSRRYDRKVTDLFLIQDEIADSVAEALVGELLPGASLVKAQGGTTDVDAFELYAKALKQIELGSFESLRSAEVLLQRAIARDRGYVDAMLKLASTWRYMWAVAMIDAADAAGRMAVMLDRVDDADPGNAWALYWRGEVATLRDEPEVARSLYERARAAAKGDMEMELATAPYIEFADEARGFEDGFRLVARALDVDPLNPHLYSLRGMSLVRVKRFDEAEADLRRALELTPQAPWGYQLLAQLAHARGQAAAEVYWTRRSAAFDPTDFDLAAHLASLSDELGDRGAAEAWFARSSALNPGFRTARNLRLRSWAHNGDIDKVVETAPELIGIGPVEGNQDWAWAETWADAVGAACYAAAQRGRVEPLRRALIAAGQLPREFSVAAFRGVARERGIDVWEVALRVQRWLPCVIEKESGSERNLRRLAETLDKIWRPEWRSERNAAHLAAVVDQDEEKLVASLLEQPPECLHDAWSRGARARWDGIADDPRVKAHLAELAVRREAERARLVGMLAAEGLSLGPPTP